MNPLIVQTSILKGTNMRTKKLTVTKDKGLRKAHKLKDKGWKIKDIQWIMIKSK
jgi:hypothetical protein